MTMCDSIPVFAAVLLGLRLVGQWVLDGLNRAELRRYASAPPATLADLMEPDAYGKSVEYTRAKLRLSSWEHPRGAVIAAILLFSGLLPWWWDRIGGSPEAGIWTGAMFLWSVGAVMAVVELPVDWWVQFRLEERFGFNRSTLRLWIVDKLKGFFIGTLLAVPLIALLLWLVASAGDGWWVWAFAVFFGFQLLMLILWPRLILPWFNKLEPLPEGSLRDRLLRLATDLSFPAGDIFVMDGSRRSTHANAFFTGFGGMRRVVLFDTLVEQMDEEEVEAVLAHEIGHYRLGHIRRRLVVGALLSFAAFALLGWVDRTGILTSAFGFSDGTRGAPVFLLFGILASVVGFWLSPLTNSWSRRHEFEADAFAREGVESPDGLIGALRKLYRKNLSNLTPHPWYALFYYSHPTLPERERALREGGSSA